MTRKVHRHTTDSERLAIPEAFTYNRATGAYHNRDGFPIFVHPEALKSVRSNQRRSKAA